METPAPTAADARPDRYRQRGRLPRWAKVVLVLLAVLLLAVVAVVVLLVWGLSGGWDGLRPGATADDRRVVAAREKAGAELDDLAASTSRAVGGTPVATLRYDRCEQGQNNWKVHDGYTLRCELTQAVVVRPAGTDVTSVAARVDGALVGDGWTSTSGTDEMTQPADPDRGFLRENRSGAYQRDDDRHQLAVTVTSQGSSPFLGPRPSQVGTVVSGDEAAYGDAVAADGLKVVALTSVRYFDDG